MDKKEETSCRRSAVSRLLDFAGPRKALTYLGCTLSAISMVVGFGPYVCIWLVARNLIAVAPNWSTATSIAMYGWWALGFSVASILLYFAGLMCTHLAAFRCAAKMRKRATEHLMHTGLGYFDTHASGALRRVVDGCAAETEGMLAHKLPDTAGSVAMIVGMLVLFFVFDWRLGLACLVPVAILLAPGDGDFGAFLANFAFYAIFSAVIPTAMTRVMFMSDAMQSATDAVNRVEEVLTAPTIKAPVAPKEPVDNSIVFEDVSFTYEGANEPARPM